MPNAARCSAELGGANAEPLNRSFQTIIRDLRVEYASVADDHLGRVKVVPEAVDVNFANASASCLLNGEGEQPVSMPLAPT